MHCYRHLLIVYLTHRLKTYEQQLAQVQGALATDKGNEELINLEAELTNLIALTKQLIGQGEEPQPSSSGSTKKTSTSAAAATSTLAPTTGRVEVKRFAAGEECQAKYAVSVLCRHAQENWCLMSHSFLTG